VEHPEIVRCPTVLKRPQLAPTSFPGDTVVVSKAGIVYVVGDVKQPGIVMENSRWTVLQASPMAQDEPDSQAQQLQVIRRLPMAPKEIPIRLKNILGKATDLVLQLTTFSSSPAAPKIGCTRSIEAVVQTATGIAIYRRP